MNTYTGLDALLTPDNCALILIDHQPFQFSALQNIDGATLINNTVGLAKTAKLFNVPTILTTVLEERGGYLQRDIQAVFPDQKPINRTFINTWEDRNVVEAVEKLGRKKIVMAGLWTDICVAMPVIHALGEGYDVFFVTDCSGSYSVEAHERSIQRMVQAGAIPITGSVFMSELQRDWARTETGAGIAEILFQHGGAIGVALAWEQQLLATPVQ